MDYLRFAFILLLVSSAVFADVNCTLDIVPPVVTVTSPVNAIYHSTINVSFTATSANATVTACRSQVDGGNEINVSCSGFLLNGLSNSAHNLTIYADDVCGLTGHSNPVSFYYDLIPRERSNDVMGFTYFVIIAAVVGLVVWKIKA